MNKNKHDYYADDNKKNMDRGDDIVCINIRLTKEERATIKAKAEKSNMSMNKYILAVLNNCIPDAGYEWYICSLLISLQRIIDDLPDDSRKRKMQKECAKLWQSLK